jgi:predicted RNase H-like nuclease (RuvC/YqgF family)
MFRVPVTASDIATSTDNLRTETATQVVSSLSQEAHTQTDIVLAELEEVLQKQKREIQKLKATIDRMGKQHGIEKRSLLRKARDMRDEIQSLKVSLNAKII